MLGLLLLLGLTSRLYLFVCLAPSFGLQFGLTLSPQALLLSPTLKFGSFSLVLLAALCFGFFFTALRCFCFALAPFFLRHALPRFLLSAALCFGFFFTALRCFCFALAPFFLRHPLPRFLLLAALCFGF